jgi:outer membrane receptor protein involved in Fe transport
MFFANTDENIKSIKADISQPYTLLKNSQNLLKIGAGYQVRKRDFTSRVLGFAPYKQGGVQYNYSLNSLPEDQIFLPQHLGKMENGLGGFLLNDGTTSNSDYSASSEIKHAYIMDDQRFLKKFRIIFGVRMESFNQKLNSPSASVGLPPITIDSTVTDFLPSVNFVYALTPKMNVRLSYTQTVNRPEFRELAPFVFYDYQAQYSISGSVNLRRAKITNYDFRYEFFPGKAQLFSFSAFYKDFVDPIEIVFVPGIAGQAAYLNSQSAKVYGVEAEIRTLVSSIFGVANEHSLLNKFTLSANAAYIKSEVKLPFIEGTGTVSRLATDRPLQGQSPYLINASFAFNDENSGISSTLSVNRVGDRLAVGGVKNESLDIYEKARTVVDFQFAKFFLQNKLEIKLNARDILAQNISTYFDNDGSKSFNSDTDVYFGSYLAPKVFSISATYKF